MAALLGCLGVALGALVRNQAVAVVGVLHADLRGRLGRDGARVPASGRFSPLSALPTAVAGIPADDAGIPDVDLLPAGLAFLALLAWIGALFAIGAALLVRRDVE